MKWVLLHKQNITLYCLHLRCVDSGMDQLHGVPTVVFLPLVHLLLLHHLLHLLYLAPDGDDGGPHLHPFPFLPSSPSSTTAEVRWMRSPPLSSSCLSRSMVAAWAAAAANCGVSPAVREMTASATLRHVERSWRARSRRSPRSRFPSMLTISSPTCSRPSL